MFGIPALTADLVKSVISNTLQFQLALGGAGLILTQLLNPGGVASTMRDHWRRFGRCYFQRHDYEALDSVAAAGMIAVLREKLARLAGSPLAGSSIVLADDFSYKDPVDGGVSDRQGLRILLADGSRIVCRLSGTGTEGAILRLYLERYRNDAGESPLETMLGPLLEAALELIELRQRCGRDRATVIT